MRCLFVLLFVSLCPIAKGQIALTFQDAKAQGIDVTLLDSLYKNVFDTDTGKGVFQGKDRERFNVAWVDFHERLMKHLNKNGLYWEKSTWCLNKMYFSKKGEVEYWLFNFNKEDQIPQERQELYKKLVLSFCKENKLKMKNNIPFSQCASIDFVNVLEQKN